MSSPLHHYPMQLLAGALLANGVPHFVQGVSGEPFQSPFAKPPGVGESSPVSNVLWGFANLAGGILLLHSFWPDSDLHWLVFAIGVLALAVQLALHFGKVRAERRQARESIAIASEDA